MNYFLEGLYMKTKIENLTQLPLNKSGKINKIECDEGIKRNIENMQIRTPFWQNVSE